jgi:hypothetical protein
MCWSQYQGDFVEVDPKRVAFAIEAHASIRRICFRSLPKGFARSASAFRRSINLEGRKTECIPRNHSVEEGFTPHPGTFR